MNNDDKILKILADLQAGQKALQDGQQALQADVKSLNGKVDTLEQGQKALEAGQEQQGKLLNGIAATMSSVLEGQQAQRVDIRALHTEVHETREELKGEIKAARAEAKMDNVDLKAVVVKKIQSQERRTTNLEEQTGIENPEKH